MKKITLLTVLTLVLLSLAGCGSKNDNVLYVYNWGDFMDESILGIFEEETGIKVIYQTYATNEEMYARLSRGGAPYDIVIPSDYMIEKMISESLLLPIDYSQLSHYHNIDEHFLSQPFDPENKYSVPYFWGTVGIIYNTNLITEEIDSWEALWNPEYKGMFTMIDSQRDSIMVALKKLGYSMNTTNLDELEEAKQLLIEQKPLVRAYVGDEVKDMLIAEEVAMSVVWSGEAGAVIQDYPHFAYALPKEGSNLWYDNVVIPHTSQNVEAAHMFIDFLCRPEIALMNAEYVGYSTVNKATMEMIDESLIGTTYAYPDWSKIENYEVFKDLGELVRQYDLIWTQVKTHN